MKKIFGVAVLLCLLVTTLFLYQAQRPSVIPAPTFAMLDEQQLTEFALQVARNKGLTGDPTQQHIQLVKASEWSITMFNGNLLQTPDLPIFILAVKGEIDQDRLIGGAIPPELPQVTPIPREGLTIALNGTTGELMVVLGRYVENPALETTDADREFYEYLQGADLEQIASKYGPPALEAPPLFPTPVLEKTEEILIP